PGGQRRRNSACRNVVREPITAVPGGGAGVGMLCPRTRYATCPTAHALLTLSRRGDGPAREKGDRVAQVRTGLDVFVARRCEPVRGLRVGLLSHAAAVDARFRSAAELLCESADVRLAVLFGPEH